MAATDRLSVLPDDVLLRILSFAPACEVAASAILSRRWRSLWRRTSAVNLDSRPYAQAEREDCSYSTPTCYAFFYHAHAVLAAFRRRRDGRRRRRRGTGLRRLTLFLEQGTYYGSKSRYSNAEQEEDRRVAQLLADPALARLEELSIGCRQSYSKEYYYCPPLATLPCAATLRVLELTYCNLEPPSRTAPTPGLAFPCLTDLRLRCCIFLDGFLQAMVDAAPALASLALVDIRQWAPEPPFSEKRVCMSQYFQLPLRLRCPTVTALLVLEKYVSKDEIEASADGGSGIELDMPSLRTFRYRGYPVKLSLISPAPGLARVDLDVSKRHQQCWGLKYEPLSRMLASLSSTRALKLRLQYFEDDVLADEEEDGGAILPTFPNLKLLELDGQYRYLNSKPAVAMARLLRSCPAMSELRLRLNKYENDIEGSFGESVERFERLASMSLARVTAVHLDGVSELPDAFTNNLAFSCLQKSLRKVTLQFEAKEVNCFQVKLAKFLVENAMVLEEMHVDDGSQFWPDHLCNKVARWRADSFRRRNLTDTAAGFRVYQLQLDNPVLDSNDESPRKKKKKRFKRRIRLRL